MSRPDTRHDWIKTAREQLEELIERSERLDDQGRIDPELRAKISTLQNSLDAANKFCQPQDKAV